MLSMAVRMVQGVCPGCYIDNYSRAIFWHRSGGVRETNISVDRLVRHGQVFEAIDTNQFPFGNACNYCAFKGTACYNETDFTCHSDSRPDGRDVVFKAVGWAVPTVDHNCTYGFEDKNAPAA